MTENPTPPPAGDDPQQPAQGWQPGWQETWQPTTGGPAPGPTPGAPPYGQPPNPQVPYGAPQGYGPFAPDHPQATTVLILGILGLVLCQVLSPFAWVMGNRVVREIDGSGGTIGGRSSANAGRICGIIGTALMGLGLLIAVGAIVIVIAGTASA